MAHHVHRSQGLGTPVMINADWYEKFGIVFEVADEGLMERVWRDIKVVRVEIRQPDEHGINLGLLRHEGGECLAVVSWLAHHHGVRLLSI